MDSLRDRIEVLVPRLYRFAEKKARTTSLRHDARDLVHESIIYALQNEKKYAQSPDLFSWLCTYVVSKLYSGTRNKKRQREILCEHVAHEPTLFPPTPYELLERLEFLKLSHKILQEKLPPHMRSLFIAWAAEDLSHGEIAKREGVPLGSVKANILRAQKRLAAA